MNNTVCRLHADKNGVVGKGVKFERIRRITGYLVGTLERFNNAKKAEEKDRVKHSYEVFKKNDYKKEGV